MGEVEPVFENGLRALAQNGATLKSVAAAMTADAPYDEPQELKAAPAVEMTDELVNAIGLLPAYFGQRQVTEIRQLTDDEVYDLGEEQRIIDAILGPLAARRDAIKETIRHHMDLTAIAEGKAGPETERDAHGHLVVARKGAPEEVVIPGTGRKYVRTYRSGSVEIDVAKLKQMALDGDIDHKDYLAMTKQVRVFDEAKALEAMSKKPHLLRAFQKVIKRGRPGTALSMKKK